MDAIRRILCPVDLSDLSRHAFAHAVALARRHGALVRVLYAAPSPVPLGAGPASRLRGVTLDMGNHDHWAGELKRFASAARGASVELVVTEGSAAADILSSARQMPADLVVMGTHGRGGFERWLLGSVTDKVLRKAGFAVMTVSPHCPEPRAEGAFGRILCALDLTASSPATLRAAVAVARGEAGHARLTLLHVVDDLPAHESALGRAGFALDDYFRYREEDARERLAGLAASHAAGLEVSVVVTAGAAWRSILQAAAREGSDLIVVGAEGGHRVGRLGSTADRVVREAACPVLTVRGEAARRSDEVGTDVALAAERSRT